MAMTNRIDRYAGTDNLTRIHDLGLDRAVHSAAAVSAGITVAVLNLDRPDLIVPMLEAVPQIAAELAEAGLGLQFLVGDTGSTHPDVLAAYDRADAHVEVVRGLAYQFSRSNNDTCDRRVHHVTLAFFNNDVYLRDAGPLLALHRQLSDPAVGVAGLVLDLPDGRLQHAGIDFVDAGPYLGLPRHPGAGRVRPHTLGASWEVPAVTGAALMLRTADWVAMCGFDERFEREGQDVDLCLRLHRAGKSTRVVDAGPLVHEENGTRPKGEEHLGDRRRYLRRWLAYTEAVGL